VENCRTQQGREIYHLCERSVINTSAITGNINFCDITKCFVLCRDDCIAGKFNGYSRYLWGHREVRNCCFTLGGTQFDTIKENKLISLLVRQKGFNVSTNALEFYSRHNLVIIEWITAHRITGLFGLFPSPGFLEIETRRFGNWICFRREVKGGEDIYSVGPFRKS
jgi:hypothetical protein